jgi:hypothetical protein
LRARASESSKATPLTLPLSISAIRRPVSDFHAVATAGSTSLCCVALSLVEEFIEDIIRIISPRFQKRRFGKLKPALALVILGFNHSRHNQNLAVPGAKASAGLAADYSS